jgi:hypothetical protein
MSCLSFDSLSAPMRDGRIRSDGGTLSPNIRLRLQPY